MNKNKREKPTPEPDQSWGVFGGAFDPIHNGHLNLAQQARMHKGLDGILFIPSVNPPHRDTLALSSFQDRLAMAHLAVEDLATCAVSSIERDLNLTGYTLDTIRALKRMYPGISWNVIIGADQGKPFHTWHRPEDILKEARLLVGARPGHASDLPNVADKSRVECISTSLVDLSSTDIRRHVCDGMAECDLSRLVPPAVASYIVKHKLYLT